MEEIEKLVREPIVPDSDLLQELRENFTVLKCSELLARVTRDICAALGVTIKYEITDVNPEPVIKRADIAKNLSGLITIVSAVLAGSKVNPISVLKDTYDVNKAQKIARSRQAAIQRQRAETAQNQRSAEEQSAETHQTPDGVGRTDPGSEQPST